MILTSSLQFTVLLKCPNSFWTRLGSPNKEGVETLNGMFCSTVCGFWHLRTSTFMVRVMVLSVAFNNISAVSQRSVLLVEKIGVSGENHRPVASH